MKLQGLKPDVALYNKIINGFVDLNKFQEAANFLDEMVLAGISPNRLTWSTHIKVHNVVIQGLSESDLNRAFYLYLSMRTRGLTVEPEVFHSLVKDEEIWKAILRGFLDQKKTLESIENFHMQLAQTINELQKLS
ncbi:pentatricopeptide repeat-containing protein At5g46100-like [Amaranthus tricolor]|uniref:pentatricopeptide repeat-containing protein At5g46100-like n=1 Tax=Amaranthus tricolor TaxID=29722 RepID=UPI002589B70A|nr:pentatricopeptide repeat-containing protein At5g46100-like [Amaranthus tricolor]